MDKYINYKINTSKIVYDTIDGEVILINFENGNYYSLNATGRDIWNLIQGNYSTSEIINEISRSYEGDQELIREETIRLLKTLKEEELVTLSTEDSSGTECKSSTDHKIQKTEFQKPMLLKYTDMREMLILDPIHEVDETGWPAVKPTSGNKISTAEEDQAEDGKLSK